MSFGMSVGSWMKVNTYELRVCAFEKGSGAKASRVESTMLFGNNDQDSLAVL